MTQPTTTAQTTASIAFIDLKAQQRRLRERIMAAVTRVLDHGQFIMGPEVAEAEAALARRAGVRRCVCCASGTDALLLPLMAIGAGPGDAVFVPAFTFVATAEAPALLGATPVFIDVEPDTFNMSASSLEAGIEAARASGFTPRAVIPVDLFGQPADYPALAEVALSRGLFVLADAAQSFGATLHGKPVGSWGDATATSFFPAKPLGCYGDGGAVFTNDDDLADRMRSIQNHGQGKDRYENIRLGMNSRFDTIQAAILLEKLTIFSDELERRQRVAGRYASALGDAARTPRLRPGAASAWAQYTIRAANRDAVVAGLAASGVPACVYYPTPLNRQPGYLRFPTAPGGVPVSEALSAQVLSLPMHPYLDEPAQDRILATLLPLLT